MAFSASWQDVAARPVRTRRGRSRRRAFQAARRHTRLVRVLRVLLPTAGISAVLVMAVMTRLSLPGDIDLSAGRLSVTRNSIIMEHPRIAGFDKDGREYFVTADRAIQAITNPDQVRLENIAAKIVAVRHGATTITAEAGDYDHGKSTLKLHGDINLNSAEGYVVHLRDADIDFEAGTMTSPNPVSVGYRESEITAERLSVSEGGKLLGFEGRVHTTLVPPKRAPAATGPE